MGTPVIDRREVLGDNTGRKCETHRSCGPAVGLVVVDSVESFCL